MIPEDKIIELIKKYRAVSEKFWNPEIGYDSMYRRGYAVSCDACADDLEELLRLERLLKSDKEGGENENKKE